MLQIELKVNTYTGFARPTTAIVSASRKFSAVVCLEFQDKKINIKNSLNPIMDIMSLEIKPGDHFVIKASGLDEHQAIRKIKNELISMGLYQE